MNDNWNFPLSTNSNPFSTSDLEPSYPPYGEERLDTGGLTGVPKNFISCYSMDPLLYLTSFETDSFQRNEDGFGTKESFTGGHGGDYDLDEVDKYLNLGNEDPDGKLVEGIPGRSPGADINGPTGSSKVENESTMSPKDGANASKLEHDQLSPRQGVAFQGYPACITDNEFATVTRHGVLKNHSGIANRQLEPSGIETIMQEKLHSVYDIVAHGSEAGSPSSVREVTPTNNRAHPGFQASSLKNRSGHNISLPPNPRQPKMWNIPATHQSVTNIPTQSGVLHRVRSKADRKECKEVHFQAQRAKANIILGVTSVPPSQTRFEAKPVTLDQRNTQDFLRGTPCTELHPNSTERRWVETKYGSNQGYNGYSALPTPSIPEASVYRSSNDTVHRSKYQLSQSGQTTHSNAHHVPAPNNTGFNHQRILNRQQGFGGMEVRRVPAKFIPIQPSPVKSMETYQLAAAALHKNTETVAGRVNGNGASSLPQPGLTTIKMAEKITGSPPVRSKIAKKGAGRKKKTSPSISNAAKVAPANKTLGVQNATVSVRPHSQPRGTLCARELDDIIGVNCDGTNGGAASFTHPQQLNNHNNIGDAENSTVRGGSSTQSTEIEGRVSSSYSLHGTRSESSNQPTFVNYAHNGSAALPGTSNLASFSTLLPSASPRIAQNSNAKVNYKKHDGIWRHSSLKRPVSQSFSGQTETLTSLTEYRRPRENTRSSRSFFLAQMKTRETWACFAAKFQNVSADALRCDLAKYLMADNAVWVRFVEVLRHGNPFLGHLLRKHELKDTIENMLYWLDESSRRVLAFVAPKQGIDRNIFSSNLSDAERVIDLVEDLSVLEQIEVFVTYQLSSQSK